jgi:WD40 repeat protein
LNPRIKKPRPESKQIVSICDAAGKELRRIEANAPGNMAANQFSPDGKYFTTVAWAEEGKPGAAARNANRAGFLRVWDVETGKERFRLPYVDRELASRAGAIGWAPDGKRFVTAFAGQAGKHEPGSLQVWDATTGKALARLFLPGEVGRPLWRRRQMESKAARAVLQGEVDRPFDLDAAVFSPDGTFLAAALTTARPANHSTVPAAALATGRLARFSRPPRVFHDSDRNPLIVWDLSTNKVRFTAWLHVGFTPSLACSPDSKQVAVGLAPWGGPRSRQQRSVVRVLDARTGVERLNLTGHKGSVRDVTFTPDGKRIVSMALDRGGHEIKVWDAVSGWEMLTLRAEGWRQSTTLDRRGQRLLTVGVTDDSWTMRTWDATPLPGANRRRR